MNDFIKLVGLGLLLLVSFYLPGQFLDLASGKNLSNSAGDDMLPCWSPNGQKLVYQTNRYGNWDLVVHDFVKDTTYLLMKTQHDEQNPTWHDNGRSIAFDSDSSGESRIYKLDEDGTMSLLFERDLQNRQASFSPSEKLVYFSGYNELSQSWQIYSYEFYYNNLNELTRAEGRSDSPKVSPDSDRVIFTQTVADYPQQRLRLINWHGNSEKEFSDTNRWDASWAPGGLKLFFVSNKDNNPGEIYSMWVDGSHLERLTNDKLEVRNPVMSPDGQWLAVSIGTTDGFELFLISMEDY